MAGKTKTSFGFFDEDLLRRFADMSPEDRIRTTLSIKDERSWFLGRFLNDLCQLRSVQILGPRNCVVVFAFKVVDFYTNPSGNLHGGAQAAIYDVCTSIALQAMAGRDAFFSGGVSRNLNVTYLRPAPEGDDLLLVCEIVSMGKSLALLRGTIKREKDGAVISVCEHDKAAVAKPGWKL